MLFSRTESEKVCQRIFLSFVRNLSNKYERQLLNAATKTGPDPLKTASKKVVHKAVEATGEFIGNKIADKIVTPNENSRNVKKITIPAEEGINIK